MPKKTPAPATAIYTLKITLLDLDPTIWRSVEIRGDTTLAKLHQLLQAAMGWENCHMHLFRVGKTLYGVPSNDDFGLPTEDERKVTVAELLPKKGSKLTYTYDMGDDWHHEIKVEKVSAPVSGTKYPRLTDGARACPPEDVGGVPGFMNLVEALADPSHEQHEELLDWVGEKFDPERFDLKAADRAVAKVR
jgi:hypothetical protein